MIKEEITSLSDSTLTESAHNSLLLKEQALALVQTVCGDGWTDHNIGDPGITLLDVLAFVISDLGFRLNFPIRELLAPDPADPVESNQQPFFLAPQILPSNTVTLADHRRAIIDIPGIKNADFVSLTSDNVANGNVSGSVDILLDLEDEWSSRTPQEKMELYIKVRQSFISARNVNQDLNKIIPIKKQLFSVDFFLAFEDINSLTNTVTEILSKTREVLSPGVRKTSKQDLKQAGYAGDDIFDGPLLKNGFILTSDVESLHMPDVIYASDVFEVLDQQAGLKRINSFAFTPAFDDPLNKDEDYLNWRFKISPQYMLKLDIEKTLDQLKIELDGQSYILTQADKLAISLSVEASYQASRSQNTEPLNTEPQKTGSEQTEFPQSQTQTNEYANEITEFISSSYRELKQYTSIQHDFPAIYKLVESRLDGEINSTELASILQLKGFLTLFDQVLADQFAQLDNLRKLLALPDQQVFIRLSRIFDKMLASENLSTSQINQFWQDVCQLPLTELSQPITDISGQAHLLGDYFEQYQCEGFQSLSEPVLSEVQLDRLNRSLEHLLGRFAEKSLDTNLLKYQHVFDNYLDDFMPIPEDISDDQPLLDKLVALKKIIDLTKIINDYPRLSKYRTGGFNYLMTDIKTQHVGGLSSRFMTFLGYSHPGQMPLATNNRESVYLLESELLRFGAGSEYQFNCLYFIFPKWPSRLQNDEFKALCHQQISRQSPVHQKNYFIELSRVEMSLFERLYYTWLNAMTQIPLVIDGSITGESPQYSGTGSFTELANINLITKLSSLLRNFVRDPGSLQIKTLSLFEGDCFPDNLIGFIKPWLTVEDKDELAGTTLTELIASLTVILNESPDEYSHISKDQILNEICHHKINQLINPFPIAKGQIGSDFRIGFIPLDYLKMPTPVNVGAINPEIKNTPKLTLGVTEPKNI